MKNRDCFVLPTVVLIFCNENMTETGITYSENSSWRIPYLSTNKVFSNLMSSSLFIIN